jgi:GNAT superfamily N-acetyltransferase
MPEKNRATAEEPELIGALVGTELDIRRGCNAHYGIQLVQKSKQEAIVRHTPADSQDRFKDPEAFQRWVEKDRYIHLLTSAEGDLCGIIWYGREAMPLAEDVSTAPNYFFAIRLYDGYRGKGLAKPFMRASLNDLAAWLDDEGKLESCRGVWLETSADNSAAMAIYPAFGYQEVGRLTTDSHDRVVMQTGIHGPRLH